MINQNMIEINMKSDRQNNISHDDISRRRIPTPPVLQTIGANTVIPIARIDTGGDVFKLGMDSAMRLSY